MALDPAFLPAGLHLTFDPAPSLETRRALGAAIDAFNARVVPLDVARFALLVHDEVGELAAGLSASLSWSWMFVDSLWVDDAVRCRGIGRALMAGAEDYARTKGCHAAWLDTFLARGFYEKLGYETFGVLEDYPAGQSRHFLRKTLR
jgi:GNAT superfamily N-acetyltransferase